MNIKFGFFKVSEEAEIFQKTEVLLAEWKACNLSLKKAIEAHKAIRFGATA